MVYVIITIIRNIIEPRIVGKQIGLHPVLTLMSMFVGTHLFGVVGLFGLPILLSLLRYQRHGDHLPLPRLRPGPRGAPAGRGDRGTGPLIRRDPVPRPHAVRAPTIPQRSVL